MRDKWFVSNILFFESAKFSTDSPCRLRKKVTAYNSRFGRACYQTLFLFNQIGGLELSFLHPGNLHGTDAWRNVLEPVVERYRERSLSRYVRGDAAFAPNLSQPTERVVVFYYHRETAEQSIKVGENAIEWPMPPCHEVYSRKPWP